MRAIDYFDKSAETYTDCPAIIDRADGQAYSYQQARTYTEKIASAMRANGLVDEERAGIFSPNDARVLLCMLGLMRAGAAWVPINHRNAIDANV